MQLQLLHHFVALVVSGRVDAATHVRLEVVVLFKQGSKGRIQGSGRDETVQESCRQATVHT